MSIEEQLTESHAALDVTARFMDELRDAAKGPVGLVMGPHLLTMLRDALAAPAIRERLEAQAEMRTAIREGIVDYLHDPPDEADETFEISYGDARRLVAAHRRLEGRE